MRIAIRGTGSIGMRHMQATLQAGGEPIAVPVRPSRIEDLASAGHMTAPSLVAAKEAGAVAAIVATDTSRHVNDVQAALEAGLHVLCEKPIAKCASEAVGLPGLAKDHGLQLYVGYCLRFDPGLQSFRSRLPAVGTIHSVRIECRSYLPDWRPTRPFRDSYSARADEGGVLRDLSHEIDYGLWLFGEPLDVRGVVVNLGCLNIASEELAEAIWHTKQGVWVSMGLDYLSRSPVRFVRASGEDGELKYDFVTGRLEFRRPGRTADVENFDLGSDELYVRQAQAFLDAAAGSSAQTLATGAEALRTLNMCDAWRRSSESLTSEESQL